MTELRQSLTHVMEFLSNFANASRTVSPVVCTLGGAFAAERAVVLPYHLRRVQLLGIATSTQVVVDCVFVCL